MKKPVVLLTGASGSMGFEAFRLLWEKRDRYDIVLLLRPSRKNKKKFSRYEKSAGITPVRGSGISQGNGLKIVWGDALDRDVLSAACTGIDWCLHPMALISPAADRNPTLTDKINHQVTRQIVREIESRDPEHIKMVYIASVAVYGGRLAPVHVGRAGDPVMPGEFDNYAISKIRGELSVMESGIKHAVSLRQTFIMIPKLFSLMDPILYHQPLNSFMENITAKDSGRLPVSCLEIPEESDFWGGFYNVSGGPDCRTTFLEFLDRIYGMLGIDYRKAMERRWFALKNFHMLFFEDASRLNQYLHHWDGGQTMEDFYRNVWLYLPWYLKTVARLNRRIPPFRWLVQKATHMQLKSLARKPDGTLGWIRNGNEDRIRAFYGSMEEYRRIPGWDIGMPCLDHDQEYRRLDHGYDESKEEIGIEDLAGLAQFRGGLLVSTAWDGNMRSKLTWRCCMEHNFEMTPRAVLKGGHWCVECLSLPADRNEIAKRSAFAAQILADAAQILADAAQIPSG